MKIYIKKRFEKNDIENFFKIFRINKKNFENEKIVWKYQKSKQFLIYLKHSKKINIGMMRIISKNIFLKNKFYRVACLSSIGVFPKFRKKGFSKLLMNKTNIYLKKNFDASILIARKKLDFFYEKFQYVGNSEFYSIIVKFKKYQKKFKKSKLSKVNNKLINCYEETNKRKNGYFKRSKNDWLLIKKKIIINKFLIKEFFDKNEYIGFIIFKDNIIYEYGYRKRMLNLFNDELRNNFKNSLEIKNPDKELLNKIRKVNEVIIKKRFCLYGGHMINYFNKNYLRNIYYNINFLDEF